MSPTPGSGRSRPRAWAHSRLDLRGGADRAGGGGGQPLASTAAWTDLAADDPRRPTVIACTPRAAGTGARRPARRRLAAAAGVRGAVPAADAGWPRPIRAVAAELAENGYVYRFRRTPARSARPKGPSCSAASSWRWPNSSRRRTAALAGSSATAPPAARRVCTPRSSTSSASAARQPAAGLRPRPADGVRRPSRTLRRGLSVPWRSGTIPSAGPSHRGARSPAAGQRAATAGVALDL